jgi:hypothetical protein
MSFFGFNSDLPKDGGLGDDNQGFSKLDEMMEEKFKYGDEGLLLDEEDDGFNDETFGNDLADIKGALF